MLSRTSTPRATDADATRLASTTATLKERAYGQLRRQIEHMELRRGERISNRQLAKSLGMSAIPVREAITQLVGEGLLEHRPGVGTFVVNPSRHEIEDIYELRIVLESYAAGRAAMAVGGRGLDEMRRAVELMRQLSVRAQQEHPEPGNARLYEHWRIADAQFHLAVLRRAGNASAVRMVTGLRLMTRVFGHRMSPQRMRNLDESFRDHHDILGAIERRDARVASRLMRAHIRGGRAIALKFDDLRRRDESAAHEHDHDVLEELSRQIARLETHET